MQKICNLPQSIRRVAAIMACALLTACGGGGGDGGTTPPPPDAVPTGYYDNTGTATLDIGNVADLQGIIHNNRLMMLSATAGLSYDGSITVSGNNYSGTLSVYDDGSLLGTAPVSGSITQGVRVAGTLTGTGAGRGSFTLNYAANNGEAAALSTLSRGVATAVWSGPLGGSRFGDYRMQISDGGSITHHTVTTDGTFDGCEMSGTITPLSGTHLYTVTITVTACGSLNGTNYTGLAATRTQDPSLGNDRLFFGVTNGGYSVSAEFAFF